MPFRGEAVFIITRQGTQRDTAILLSVVSGAIAVVAVCVINLLLRKPACATCGRLKKSPMNVGCLPLLNKKWRMHYVAPLSMVVLSFRRPFDSYLSIRSWTTSGLCSTSLIGTATSIWNVTLELLLSTVLCPAAGIMFDLASHLQEAVQKFRCGSPSGGMNTNHVAQ